MEFNSYSNFSNKTLDMVIERNDGYIMVTANGGMNQQRVAVSDTLEPDLLFFFIPIYVIALEYLNFK